MEFDLSLLKGNAYQLPLLHRIALFFHLRVPSPSDEHFPLHFACQLLVPAKLQCEVHFAGKVQCEVLVAGRWHAKVEKQRYTVQERQYSAVFPPSRAIAQQRALRIALSLPSTDASSSKEANPSEAT